MASDMGTNAQNVPQNVEIHIKTYPELPFFCFFVCRSEQDPDRIMWLACNMSPFGISLPTSNAMCFSSEEEADKYAQRLINTVMSMVAAPPAAQSPQLSRASIVVPADVLRKKRS